MKRAARLTAVTAYSQLQPHLLHLMTTRKNCQQQDWQPASPADVSILAPVVPTILVRPNAKRQAISDGRPYRHYSIFVPTKGISLTYFLPATICAIHRLLGSCFADEERQRPDVSRAVRACAVVAGAIVHQDVRKKG